MAKIKTLLITAAGILITLSGCDVNDPIYNTDHPDKGSVKINTGWNNIGEGITKPAAYIVEVGNNMYNATTDVYSIPALFDPGNYKMWLYNRADGTEVKNGVATVNKIQGTGRADETYIEPMPGWLFTGKLQEDIHADADHEFTLEMYQQIRRLTLILKPQGSATDRIKTITASLSGVAASWNIETNQPTADAANVTLSFTRITEGENAGSWQATALLLGVAGAQQKLTGIITYEDGNPTPTTLESDLTTGLAGFNTDKITPLTLGGQVEVPIEPGFTAIISDWVVEKNHVIID